MELSDYEKQFVLHWGEMGTHWGINRTVAQLHALLYLAEEPLDAATISEALNVARSNVSTSLKELIAWGLIRVVHVLGDRKDHFQAEKDPLTIFQIIARERKKREIDPVLSITKECLEKATQYRNTHVSGQLVELVNFIESVNGFYEWADKLPPKLIKRLLKLQRKIEPVLGGKS